jgi:hypothetical protein
MAPVSASASEKPSPAATCVTRTPRGISTAVGLLASPAGSLFSAAAVCSGFQHVPVVVLRPSAPSSLEPQV